jgi:glycosyltransferase involved in cell wall biosynthesis
MKKVLLVHPSLQPPGGGNGVAAWMLHALAPEHHVTVLSWQPVKVEAINRFFGTQLTRSDFDTIEVPRSWRALIDSLPVPASLLKQSLLMRYTRRFSAGFDVVVGLHNETDYGRRGIQYVNYPTYLRPRPEVDRRWYHPPEAGLNLYYALADRIAGASRDNMQANLTLVNSDWAGEQVSRFLNVATQTLYPPVVDPAPGLPWAQRRNGFLAVGRISPEKDYERVMRILARVRERVPDITLTIVGTVDRHSRRYFQSLASLAASLGPWIQFRHDLSRGEVRELMASHRYGIHGMREEHFGMAPAEMARAGAIVWVPRGGGQMEIVGHEPALMFDTDEEAVGQITRTAADPEEQQRLLNVLEQVAEQFTTDRFVRHVREIVGAFEG